MLLERLALINFGGYRGRQELDLMPLSPDRPVILVGGLNGVGKTTLLHAVQLALYGAQSGLFESGSYESYLERLIHRGVSRDEGAGVELTIRITDAAEVATLTIRRRWCRRRTNIGEELLVFRNGSYDPVLTDTWADAVEKVLPRAIAPFTFFDGEKIADLADPDSSASALRTGVQSLLGIGLLGQLGTDLGVLARRAKPTVDLEAQRALDLLEAMVENAELDQRNCVEIRAAAAARADGRRNEFRKAQDAFRRAGGDLFERRQDLELTVTERRKELGALDAELVDLAGGCLPLFLCRKLLARVKDRADTEQACDRDRLMLAALAKRDEALLRLIESAPIRMRSSVQSFLDADRSERTERAGLDKLLNLSPQSAARLEGLDLHLRQERRQVAALLAQRSAAIDRLEEGERELAMVPEGERIAPALERYERAQLALAEAESAFAAADEAAHAANKRADDLQAKRERHLGSVVDSLSAADDAGRLVRHAAKVRATLEQLERRLVDRHLNRITDEVTASYGQLLRKKQLLRELRIDPHTFQLSLLDRNGGRLESSELSAGERQLLAVSMLWGLVRSSGRPLPLIVDTPLARLDSFHREALVDRYFPQAAHQVILLSTDEEITAPLAARLAPAISRSYELVHDDSLGVTMIRKGYFWEESGAA